MPIDYFIIVKLQIQQHNYTMILFIFLRLNIKLTVKIITTIQLHINAMQQNLSIIFTIYSNVQLDEQVRSLTFWKPLYITICATQTLPQSIIWLWQVQIIQVLCIIRTWVSSPDYTYWFVIIISLSYSKCYATIFCHRILPQCE